MRTIRGEEAKISLRRGTFLVIRGILERTLWNPEAQKERSPGNQQILFQLDEAERRALNWLAGAIERGVTESMSAELPQLIAEEKRWIMSRHK